MLNIVNISSATEAEQPGRFPAMCVRGNYRQCGGVRDFHECRDARLVRPEVRQCRGCKWFAGNWYGYDVWRGFIRRFYRSFGQIRGRKKSPMLAGIGGFFNCICLPLVAGRSGLDDGISLRQFSMAAIRTHGPWVPTLRWHTANFHGGNPDARAVRPYIAAAYGKFPMWQFYIAADYFTTTLLTLEP